MTEHYTSTLILLDRLRGLLAHPIPPWTSLTNQGIFLILVHITAVDSVSLDWIAQSGLQSNQVD
jgi:hypothetical protein